MALVHCDETVEKLIRRLECHLQGKDMEKAKELSEKVKELYEVRQSNRNLLGVEKTYAPWSKTCPTRT
jgi:hypothetical protein